MNKQAAKILVIDDDPIQHALLDKIISNLGFEYKAIRTAEEGLSTALEWQPDIILLDVYLPDTSGIELLDKIKAEKSLQNVFVALMSSDTSEDTTVIGLLKDANEFIYKPFRATELSLKIRTWVERQKSKEELSKINSKLTQERKVLSQYFSDDVVKKIVNSDLKEQMTGENLTATILFFDIRNFTTISENLEPHLVAELLNYIFTDIMDLILSHHGSVNKLIGDAILATFGAPISSEKDPENAVRCALAIRETIKSFNTVKPHYMNEEDIKTGIGITTGQVFAGNIGSFRRIEYTVIGDKVNTASRLQNLTKKAGVDILIDAETRRRVGRQLKARKVKVKGIRGKKEHVEIYTADAWVTRPDLTEQDEEEVTFF